MLKEFFATWVPRINAELERIFDEKLERARNYREINETAVEYAKRFTLSPGKRVRPILFIAGLLSQGIKPSDSHVKVASAIELIHSFLLIHDDIMDRDEFRRGLPTVWKYFNNDGFDWHTSISFAITTGDLVYTYALQTVLETDLTPREKELILKRMLNTVETTGYGQNIDMLLPTLPFDKASLEDVFLVDELKTGVYTVAFPLTLGAELGGADRETLEALFTYGMKVGVAFQIHDDILGVFGDPKKTGKPAGNDIREGKKTVLLLEALRRADGEQRRTILEALGSEDEEKIEKAKEVIREVGALDYARKLERNLVEEGKQALEELNLKNDIDLFLREFADFVITREK